jgi:hypothetical protein
MSKKKKKTNNNKVKNSELDRGFYMDFAYI